MKSVYPEAETLVGTAAAQELTEIFDLYLADYAAVRIEVDGKSLDVAECIVSREQVQLNDTIENGTIHNARLDVIGWKDATNRTLYSCNDDGLPLSRLERRFHIGNFQFPHT